MTKYTIYWTLNGYPSAEETTNMIHALELMRQMRDNPSYSAIAMATEDSNQVGKMGVDSIEDGILPDGQSYEYAKRREQS